MRIVLVSLYDLFSYGIRGLHSTLVRDGYEVKSLYFRGNVYKDRPYTSKEVDDFAKLIAHQEPQIVGIGLRSPLLPMFKELVPKIREYSDAKILVGGHHATANPKSLSPYADFICRGEGENVIIAEVAAAAIADICAAIPAKISVVSIAANCSSKIITTVSPGTV